MKKKELHDVLFTTEYSEGIAYLTDEQASGFQSDFRYVVDYFIQMRKNGMYKGPDEHVEHIREVLQLLSVLADDRRFWELAEDIQKEQGIRTMSEALDRIEQPGIEQGEEKMAKLVRLLLAEGRYEDALRAATDKQEREKLFQEFAVDNRME